MYRRDCWWVLSVKNESGYSVNEFFRIGFLCEKGNFVFCAFSDCMKKKKKC